MLKLLIKKQMMEIFRAYFYDAKKNTRRKIGSTIALFALYIVLMVGVIGGTFAFISVTLCKPFVSVGMGWFYFDLTGMIAIAIGAFGSVFSTYSGLYLSKDNDLLLSLPIPVSAIIASRLASVYLLGLMYSAVVSVPALIVYLINDFSVGALIGSLINVFLISVFVAILSCLLGWVVAKISQKLKSKSFITVIVSVAFIFCYYAIYFNAQKLLTTIIGNAAMYGSAIKGRAYILYLLGKGSEGDIPGLIVAAVLVGVLGALTWLLLSKSFVSIATSTGSVKKVSGELKRAKRLSIDQTLFRSELRHFASNANYMLNCGLGTLMLIVAAVALFVMGGKLEETLGAFLGEDSGCAAVLLTAGICAIVSMNDMAAPSVSLEGKSLWIKQSLPVTGWQVLKAKFMAQLILTLVPTVICLIPALIHSGADAVGMILMAVFIIIYITFFSAFSLFLGMRSPNFTWTNELMPIKQSMAIMIALLGGWLFALIVGAVYFMVGETLGLTLYLVIACVIFGGAAAILLHYLRTKDAKKFAEL